MGRRGEGRRFEMFEVSTSVGAKKVEIRYNGTFYADVGATRPQDTDIETLRSKLRQAVYDSLKIEWAYFIGVTFEREDNRHYWKSGTHSISLSTKLLLVGKGSDGKRVSVDCHMATHDRVPHIGHEQNNTHLYPDEPCCSKPDTDLKTSTQLDVVRAQSFREGYSTILLPYTPERWAALKVIEDGIDLLQQKLEELLPKDPAEAEKRLDKMLAAREFRFPQLVAPGDSEEEE